MRGVVAALLVLFPAGFRRRFGAEMLAIFDTTLAGAARLAPRHAHRA